MTPPRGHADDASIARRLPGFDALNTTRRTRRIGTLFAVTVLLAGGVALGLYFSGRLGTSHASQSTSSAPSSVAGSRGATGSPQASATPPPVSAALSATQLAAPIDGELLLPGGGSQIVIAGGATTHGSPAQGVFTLDTSTGKLLHVGNLATGLANAAGAVMGGQDVVFGGTSTAATPAVQALPAPGAPGSATAATHAAVQTAAPIGSLPKPRADAAAITIGATTYLVGGDDGSTPDPAVLATVDGRAFSTAASLPVPVRSPAVAALGRVIYVFGGLTTSSPGVWTPVDTIQALDTATHKVRTVGRLPQPLSEASAVTVGNRILILGGATAAASQAPATPASPAAGSQAASPLILSFSTARAKTSDARKAPIRYQVAPAGQLPRPVANAGVTLVGSTAWLVGGQSNGAPVSAVQTIAVQPVSVPGR